MEFHPTSSLFHMMSDSDLNRLAEDIKADGLHQPITLYQGKVLDGRNRLEACRRAKVQPRFEEWKETEKNKSPVRWVISQNLHRRHLTATQKAFAAAEAEPMLAKEIKHGGPRKKGQKQERIFALLSGKASQAAGKAFGVSARYVEDAKAILKAAPELASEGESGAKTMAELKRVLARKAHAQKLKQPAPIRNLGPFDLILADPPWQYEHCEANNREIDNHYKPATLTEIFAHKPNSSEDSILLLWATAPKLEEAMQVMAQWGFNYRTCAVWDKEVIGMGYWWRIQHELLLMGVRGTPATPPESERISSMFRAKRGRHSVKPLAVIEWIERAFPTLAKLEMYSRKPRPGWTAWGNEV